MDLTEKAAGVYKKEVRFHAGFWTARITAAECRGFSEDLWKRKIN